jgi:RNA polymerase sigma-70 factor (ECF subfamily)
MPRPQYDPDKTRASLLERVRDLGDEASWQEFFDIYSDLIYGVARQAGLRDSEAQDVMQETFKEMAKQMPGFRYDRKLGSFKAWLLKNARWRIADQFRKRLPVADLPREGETQTSPIERVVDPESLELDAIWEADWQRTLYEAAVIRVKQRIDPEKYQIFDLYVRKGWPAEKVAKAFGVSVNVVYVARSRIKDLIEEEVERLEREAI